MDEADPLDTSPTATGVEGAGPGSAPPPGGALLVGDRDDSRDEASAPLPTGRARGASARRRWTIVTLGILASVLCALAAVVILVRATAESRAPMTDAFTGAGPMLAGSAAVDGGQWEEVGGTFVLDEGNVIVEKRAPATRAVAVFVPDGNPTVITSRLLSPASASGLVFRFRDSLNYWSLVAAPEFGTWNLSRTVEGETSFVTNTGLGFAPGGTVLEVRLDGITVQIYRNGVLAEEVRSPVLGDARGVGLLASAADQARTIWSSLDVETDGSA